MRRPRGPSPGGVRCRIKAFPTHPSRGALSVNAPRTDQSFAEGDQATPDSYAGHPAGHRPLRAVQSGACRTPSAARPCRHPLDPASPGLASPRPVAAPLTQAPHDCLFSSGGPAPLATHVSSCCAPLRLPRFEEEGKVVQNRGKQEKNGGFGDGLEVTPGESHPHHPDKGEFDPGSGPSAA